MLHEVLDAADAVLQSFIRGMGEAGAHCKPGNDTEGHYATREHEEIPSR